MTEIPKKQRKRVPISCLICKKRKVKCDKGRPACGGCIKNGVAHLCEYMEPHWSKGGASLVPVIESPSDITSQQQMMIANQRREIDDLKNQLQCLKNTSGQIVSSTGVGTVNNDNFKDTANGIGSTKGSKCNSGHMNSGDGVPDLTRMSINSISSRSISILNKLRPLSASSRDLFQVYGQSNYRIVQVNNQKYFVDKYSWMSLVKLDPKLINLWLKMIKFQQYYLAYKKYQNANRNKQGSNQPTSGNTHNIFENENNLNSNESIQKPQLKCPISHTPSLNEAPKCPISHSPKINLELKCPISHSSSIDLEQDMKSKCPVSHSSSIDLTLNVELKCPVINTSHLVDSNSIISSETASPTPAPTIKNRVTTSILLPPNSQVDKDINIRISKTMKYLQNSWESMITLSQNYRINDKQLHFLMEFYFNDNANISIDSKNILLFYKSEITGIVIKKGENVMFDCTSFMSQEKDESLLQDLLVKGSYLCMLSIIVDESLSYLNHLLKIQPNCSTSIQFQSLFPDEIIEFDRTPTNIFSILNDFLINFKSSNNSTAIGPFLPFIVVVIAWIKQQIVQYNKRDYSDDYKTSFTEVITSYLQLILNENSMIEVWKDPYSVKFKSSSVKSDDDLAVHLCYIWVEFIRLNNLMNFKLIPSLKNSELLDGFIRQLYSKIEEADYSKCHVNFLEELKVRENKYQDLIIHLESQYLISRINTAVNHGVMCLGEPKLTIGIFQDLINQSIQQSEKSDSLPQRINQFESSCILKYLTCFMSHVIILQGEHCNDQEIISIIPDYFIKFAKFIEYLKIEIEKESKTQLSQYILLVITEFLTKSIQILTGIILRISSEESTKPHDVLVNNQIKQSQNIKQAPYKGMTLTDLVRKTMASNVDESLKLLRESSFIDQNKIQKLSNRWTDYSTITSKVNYSEIHQHVPELVGEFYGNGETGKNNSKRAPSHPSKSNFSSDEFRRCPISHITTDMDDNPETPRIQGVLAHQSLEVEKDRKRKCPYIDSSQEYKRSGFDSKPVESNIRERSNDHSIPKLQPNSNGQSLSFTKSQIVDGSNTKIKIENNNSHLESKISPSQPQQELNLDSFPVPAYDFNSLSDLNFDFFQQDGFSTDLNFTYENIFGDTNFEFY